MKRLPAAAQLCGAAMAAVASFFLLTGNTNRFPGGDFAVAMVGLAGSVLLVCGGLGRRAK